MRWTIPNILTLLRLLAAPAVAVMFLYFSRPAADWFAMVLFIAASVTDYIDGYLARAWKQESVFGAMLDPIADKAMVVIALLVIAGFSGMNPWILLPATMIIFREIFVSGMREFLGAKAATLKVTKIAKWKTFAQMIALTVLFATGIFEHSVVVRSAGLDEALVTQILAGDAPDDLGLRFNAAAANLTWWTGVVLLWIAAALTLLTGADYLRKAMPFLRQDKP